MLRLIYISTSVKEMDSQEFEKILEVAQVNNKLSKITGLLIVKGRTFIQCLEGEEVNVKELFEKIQKDERHKDITILEYETIDERYFPNWNMGFKNIEQLSEIESKKLKHFEYENKEELPSIFKKFAEIQ